MSTPPAHPRIYHIVHVDRLPSIIESGRLWCDAEATKRVSGGTTIGMNDIKKRRLSELKLDSYPDLHVGDCVPFYFCPRSVMLYVIHRANSPELTYHGGQGQIVHLVFDVQQVRTWAMRSGTRLAFTTSNAGSRYFEDYCDLDELDRVDWRAIKARQWQGCKEGKQAEFLIEKSVPWSLVMGIGVMSDRIRLLVGEMLISSEHQPVVKVMRDWYY